jgi:hypothetical protein
LFPEISKPCNYQAKLFFSPYFTASPCRRGSRSHESHSYNTRAWSYYGTVLLRRFTLFDAPKVDFINGTSFDWWYFDAVSSDGSYQLTITFYNTVATTLGFATGFGTTSFVSFTALNPNGTEYQQFGFAGPAIVSDGIFGIDGNWTGTGFTFSGSADSSQYRIDINSPALSIDGSLTFESARIFIEIPQIPTIL